MTQLGVMTLARLLINTGLRMVYPFAPAFARGLGIPVAEVYQLVALRSFAGLLSPLFGPLSERYGRKPVMFGSMVLFAVGCLVVAVWPAYWALGITLSVVALAKVIYDPAMQSYVGERVPYASRGRVLSLTELSWAGALLLGAPAISLAITRQGWRASFFWLAIMGMIAAVILWRFLPRTFAPTPHGATLRAAARVVRQHRVIWAAMAYVMLSMAANETLLIVFGDWMESAFGLSLVALGFSAGVIGGAEVTGELIAGVSVDRFGKRPVIITTGALSIAANFLLPFSGVSLPFALAAYFVVFLLFEITVVGGVPLLTEIVPAARAVVMSTVLAAAALGRAVGAWLGAILFMKMGYVGNGVAAAVLMGTAVVILALWVREYKTTEIAESTTV